MTDPTPEDRVVALGLDGGPKITPGWGKPALALVTGGRTYLVDCGYDTPNRLVAAGLRFADVHDVFITHHHVDHVSGIPGLVLHGWTTPHPLPPTVRFWGPPRTGDLLRSLRATFAESVRLYTEGGGFGPFPALEPHEVKLPASTTVHRVTEDDLVVVDATRVSHGPEVADAYAYRFTLKSTGRTVVFSGDTSAPNDNLIALARDCDVLVHEAQDNSRIPDLLRYVPEGRRGELREHLLVAHSDLADLPVVADAANARTLVLSHYTPLPQPPEVLAAKVRVAADAVGYTGLVVAPAELDVITL